MVQAKGRLPDDVNLHHSVVGYLSDMALLGSARGNVSGTGSPFLRPILENGLIRTCVALARPLDEWERDNVVETGLAKRQRGTCKTATQLARVHGGGHMLAHNLKCTGVAQGARVTPGCLAQAGLTRVAAQSHDLG